jgi:hypothetical protein
LHRVIHNIRGLGFFITQVEGPIPASPRDFAAKPPLSATRTAERAMRAVLALVDAVAGLDTARQAVLQKAPT